MSFLTDKSEPFKQLEEICTRIIKCNKWLQTANEEEKKRWQNEVYEIADNIDEIYSKLETVEEQEQALTMLRISMSGIEYQ